MGACLSLSDLYSFCSNRAVVLMLEQFSLLFELLMYKTVSQMTELTSHDSVLVSEQLNRLILPRFYCVLVTDRRNFLFYCLLLGYSQGHRMVL